MSREKVNKSVYKPLSEDFTFTNRYGRRANLKFYLAKTTRLIYLRSKRAKKTEEYTIFFNSALVLLNLFMN